MWARAPCLTPSPMPGQRALTTPSAPSSPMWVWWRCRMQGWTSWLRCTSRTKKTPAVIEFVDIAGLVKGASQGAGLGNKFLENIRRTDAIVHVVRCFDDENIMHVVADAGTNVPVDPLGDIETIDLELIMADLEMVNRRVEKGRQGCQGRQEVPPRGGGVQGPGGASGRREIRPHLRL